MYICEICGIFYNLRGYLFFVELFLSHRFHRYTQIFLGTFFKSRRFRRWRRFFFIGWHGIYSEVSCGGDYSRIFAEATCSVVADTPWDWTKRFTRDSIKNLWKSVKSVGQKKTPTKKICVICEICVTKNVPRKIMKQNPPRKTCETKEQREGEPRQLFLLGSQTNIEITQLSWRYA